MRCKHYFVLELKVDWNSQPLRFLSKPCWEGQQKGVEFNQTTLLHNYAWFYLCPFLVSVPRMSSQSFPLLLPSSSPSVSTSFVTASNWLPKMSITMLRVLRGNQEVKKMTLTAINSKFVRRLLASFRASLKQKIRDKVNFCCKCATYEMRMASQVWLQATGRPWQNHIYILFSTKKYKFIKKFLQYLCHHMTHNCDCEILYTEYQKFHRSVESTYQSTSIQSKSLNSKR